MEKLSDIFEQPISGEWGKELDPSNDGVPVIRTTNFTNVGRISYDNIVYRNIDIKRHKNKILQNGDIIIEKSGGTPQNPVGRVVLFEVPDAKVYFCNNFTGILRLRKKYNPKYMLYLLQYLYNVRRVLPFQNKTTGIANLQLKNYLSQTEVDIPTIEKQDYCVGILQKCQYLIDKYHFILTKLDGLVKSRFIEMFGDPVTNPMGWPVKKLSDVAEYYNGLTYHPEYTANEGTLVLRASNIQEGRLAFDDNVFVSCDIKEKYFVKDNDILMCSRNGSVRLVGKVAVIRDIEKPMTFGAFMMIIRSELWAYLYVYFQMTAFRRQIITGKTSTINQITGKMLNAVQLPIPSKDSVEVFMKFTQFADKSRFIIRKLLEKYELIKAVLMQEYFG